MEDLKNILLTKRRQTQKSTYYTWNPRMGKPKPQEQKAAWWLPAVGVGGGGGGLTTEQQEGTFWADGSALHLDSSGRYMSTAICQNSALQMSIFTTNNSKLIFQVK